MHSLVILFLILAGLSFIVGVIFELADSKEFKGAFIFWGTVLAGVFLSICSGGIGGSFYYSEKIDTPIITLDCMEDFGVCRLETVYGVEEFSEHLPYRYLSETKDSTITIEILYNKWGAITEKKYLINNKTYSK